MKAKDLDLRELLELDSAAGHIRFAGHRALIFDAAAFGILRKELIDTLGVQGARGIVTHFGYVHGWRTAEALRSEFPWDSERDWQRAGGRLHTLQGLVSVEVPVESQVEGPAPFAEAVWKDSFEAEQHLAQVGRSDACVCWMLVGFASGYLSCVNGQPIYCIEDRCVARGDATCHMVGRTEVEWGSRLEEHRRFYGRTCFESSIAKMVEELKKTEAQLRRRKKALGRGAAGEIDDASGIIAKSDVMQRLISMARRLAKVESTVLVTGESGAGKERLAQLVHDESARASGPFIAVNCAAVTESLLESELFGHAKGAFTGAAGDRAGLFEAAHGGTLFLDEVGEVPAPMQAKLLRVLQEREVRRVGENKSRTIDVRVVAATNRDLAAEVAAGRFRKDLYYRLRVVELRVPPLRERRDDVLPLARLLLADAAERMGRKTNGLTAQAADQILRYSWPGNVRELGNAMERAMALAEGDRIELADLPEEVRAALPSGYEPGAVKTLDDVEREYILAALTANDGHQARTAKQLGIGTATLYRKLKAYGTNPRA